MLKCLEMSFGTAESTNFNKRICFQPGVASEPKGPDCCAKLNSKILSLAAIQCIVHHSNFKINLSDIKCARSNQFQA